MSIAVLTQVYDEMRRLAIAGSMVAAGDFRLKKLIAPLEQAGAKAPVFAKVAQAVQAVVDSNEKTASAALLELTTLVNAILYTQGETGIAGDLQAIETSDLGGQQTQASARVLKPLLEALSTTGSGRLELIRDAQERGAFRDLRLIKPALNALDDVYPEIGDLICEKVLPTYGKSILPELRAKFDVKGRGGHVRRLQLMHQLDPDGTRDLVKQALDEGSKEIKVAAIECLGAATDDLSFLMEQAKAKAKDVRAAALGALTKLSAAASDVIGVLKKAIAGPDLLLILDKVQESPLPDVLDFLLEQAQQHLTDLFKAKDKKQQGAAIDRLCSLLRCLEDRTDPKTEAFLLQLFSKSSELTAIKSEPSGSDLNEQLADIMTRCTEKTRQALVAQQASLTGPMLTSAFIAARVLMTPAKLYETFGPQLKPLAQKRSKKNADEYDRADAVMAGLGYRHYGRSRYYYDPDECEKLPDLASGWLDAAVDAQHRELVCQLARPNHAGAAKFLSDQFAELMKKKDTYEAHSVLEAMIRMQHAEACDLLIHWLQQQAKATYYGYYSYWMSRLISELPKSDLPKIEAVLPTLPDKMVDHLMDSVMALKNK